MKKLISFALVLLMLTTLVSMPVMAKSGEFFGGLTWTLEENTLIISGEGAMPDWSAASKTPWYSSRGTITTIKIEEGNDILKAAKLYAYHNIEDSFSVPIQVIVNSKILKTDQPPVLVEGRTLIPLRLILEALGATVVWDPATQKVTTERAGIKVEFTIGSKTIYVNGQKTEIDVPSQLINKRTLVPVRAVSESFQLKVL